MKMMLFRISILLGIGAAAGWPKEPGPLIRDVPHVRQKPDFCGEACAEMFLRKLGKEIDQDRVFDLSGLDPALGRGCHTAELARALRAIGFEVGDVWGTASARRADADMEARWLELREDLDRGVPSIVCMRTAEREGASEHFRLVLGFDAAAGEVIYHEPAEENGAYRRMKKDRFLDLWPLRYGEDRWTVIRLRLESAEPEKIAEPPPVEGFSRADFAQHILALRKRLPGEGFAVVLEPPFVVIGDEPEAAVRRRARDTIRWAVERLKTEYFEKDPEAIIDIWLFKDRASYERNVKALFGSEPSTPFGYYSREDRALVMNIATGGGTLVHEIVHPFIEANFPGCPSWFNEGLASLYEQCADRGGRIAGLTNWRLAGLQEAIRTGSVPSFEKLTATDSFQFYRLDRGTNYSQARYLCYYLQEKGLLRKFYREFRSGCGDDPTGYRTLKKVLGRDDMDAFKKEWEDFVLRLEFP